MQRTDLQSEKDFYTVREGQIYGRMEQGTNLQNGVWREYRIGNFCARGYFKGQIYRAYASERDKNTDQYRCKGTNLQNAGRKMRSGLERFREIDEIDQCGLSISFFWIRRLCLGRDKNTVTSGHYYSKTIKKACIH